MDLHTLAAILGTVLLGTGIAIWRLPVGTCPDCPHCRELARQRELEREREETAELERRFGILRCSRCHRYHPGTEC